MTLIQFLDSVIVAAAVTFALGILWNILPQKHPDPGAVNGLAFLLSAVIAPKISKMLS
jgi:hypothetical protein